MSDRIGSGRIEDRPFAVLAGIAFQDSAGGELRLESGDRARSVWFLGGNPVAVVSGDPRDHVAQVLLEHGKVQPADAGRLAALPETREGLAGADFVAKDVLNWGLKYRFVNLCYDLFRWEDGDYAFRPGNPPKELLLLKIPAHTLVIKGIGYVPRHVLVEALPDDARLAAGAVSAAAAPWLGPEERSMLEECRPGRTVGEVLGRGWDDVDQARQLLYALVCLGLAALERGAEPPLVAPAEAGPVDFELAEPEVPEVAPAAAPAAAGAFALETPGEEEPALHMPAAPVPGAPPSEDFLIPPQGEVEDTYPAGAGASGFGFGSFEEEDAHAPSPAEETEEPPRKRFSLGALPRAAWIGAAGVVVLAAAGSWYWFFGRETERAAAPVARVAPRRKPPAAGQPQPAAPAPAPAPGAPPAPGSAPPPQGPALLPPAPSAPPPPPAPPAAPAPTAAPAPVVPAPAPPPIAAQPPPASPAPPAPVAAPQPASAPAAEPAAELPRQELSARYSSGLDVYRAGDLEAAAAVWESLLAEQHARELTVLAATLCEPASVRALVRSFGGRAPVFLVTKQVQGRGCFRVCYGTFGSRDAARRALAAMPAELRSSGAAVWPVADVLSKGR